MNLSLGSSCWFFLDLLVDETSLGCLKRVEVVALLAVFRVWHETGLAMEFGHLIFNFDGAIRCPATHGTSHSEKACVVFARKIWQHDLKELVLFSHPNHPNGPTFVQVQQCVQSTPALVRRSASFLPTLRFGAEVGARACEV